MLWPNPRALALTLALSCAACPANRRAQGADQGDGSATTGRPAAPPRIGPAALLPYPAIHGWTMAEPVETYGRSELERLVNGGAELYYSYGYRAAAAAEYRNGGAPDAALRIEVFDMGSPLGAFGYLAAGLAELRDPATAESPGVTELRAAGVIGTGSLSFYRGDHLFRLVLQESSPEATEESLDVLTREHLPRVARRLARNVPGESTLPPELAPLPEAGRVRRSEQYHPEHLLDLDDAGRGVSALYGDPGPRFRLGLPLDLDEEGARAAYQRLAARLAETRPVEGIGEAAVRGTLGRRGVALVARRGVRVAVLVAESPDDAPRERTLVRAARAAVDPQESEEPSAPPRPGP